MATAVVECEASIGPEPIGAFGLALEDLAADVLAAIVNGALAWSSFEDLADAMGKGDASARLAIRAAESLGWLVYWPECPSGAAYTLEPIAADRLAMAIGPDGRWHAATSPKIDGNFQANRTPHKRAEPGTDYEPADSLAWAVDPAATDPALSAEQSEELMRLATIPKVRRLLAGSAFPMRLLGTGMAWPVARIDGVCQACGPGRLDIDEVCLCCHRSGIDALLGRVGSCRKSYKQTAGSSRGRKPVRNGSPVEISQS